MNAADQRMASFDAVERVVADPLRFKLRLGIGEDAYGSLKLKKLLQEFWDVGGVAASGASVAASPVIATTFFASTASGGLLSILGLGAAAATPVGWVAAMALASGGAYYGVTRLFRGYAGSMFDTIPRFINTPIDLLAASLFDLVGALAVRVAAIDGHLAEPERDVIVRHFVGEWGLDAAYVDRALRVLIADDGQHRVKHLARAVATFQVASPDCNPGAMHRELMTFLREVVEADGVMDEREEMALDAIETAFARETEMSFARAGKSIAALSDRTNGAVKGLAARLAPRAGSPSR